MWGWGVAIGVVLWLGGLWVVVGLCRAADDRRDAWREERLSAIGALARAGAPEDRLSDVDELERLWWAS